MDARSSRLTWPSSTAATTAWRSWACSRTASPPRARVHRALRRGPRRCLPRHQHLRHPRDRARLSPRATRARGALPADFRYAGAHNTFSVAAFVRARWAWKGRPPSSPRPARPAPRSSPARSAVIEAGLIDAAVVGGVDSLCLTTLYGFHSLQLVSRGTRAGRSTSTATASRSARRRPSRCWSARTRRRERGASCWRRRRVERCAPHVRAASAGPRRARGDAARARRRGSRARRDRLHQPARHRHAEQRPRREPRGRGAPRAARPVQLHQGRHRPHARGGRRARGGDLRARRCASGFMPGGVNPQEVDPRSG